MLCLLKIIRVGEQKGCFLGSCDSIQDFVTQENFTEEDVAENIVYLYDTDSKRFHCLNREGFQKMMMGDKSVVVEWVKIPNTTFPEEKQVH